MSGATLTQINNGDVPDASVVMSNFNAINNKFNTGFTDSDITAGGINNVSLGASAAIDLSKLAASAWTSWSTSWIAASGGNPAIGNGTLTAVYIKIGRLVVFRIDLTSGSSTTWGGTTYTFSSPTSITGPSANTAIGTGTVINHGVTVHCMSVVNGANTLQVNLLTLPSGSYIKGEALAGSTNVGSGNWVSGTDTIHFWGAYESTA